MAVMTGDFLGGNCDNIQYFPDRIECTPLISEGARRSGMVNHTYMWRALITGEPGEKVNVTVRWPRYDVSTVDKEKNQYWYVHSFAEVVKDAFYYGEDELNWTRIEDVEKKDYDFSFTLTLPESGKLYAGANLPFTAKALNALTEEFAAYKVPLCRSARGVDIPMFRFGTGKNVIWLQANQHEVEVSGSHALTGLMRYLVRPDTDLGNFSFFIIPSVAVDFVMLGKNIVDTGENINRNWGHRDMIETAAIHEKLQSLQRDGCRLLVMTDMHNGWCREDDSGGNYTEFTRGFVSEAYWQRRIRFAKALLSTVDYERPDKIWWHDFGPIRTFNMYGSQTYSALCSTMEFSRYEIWDQKKGGYVPVTQERLYRMGEQLAKFLLSYDYDLNYEQETF